MLFAPTRTPLEMIILGEGSQKQKDKHRIMSLIRGI